MRVLLLDNYDSFVYNLAQYLGELGVEPIVYRNDQITLEKAKKLKPDRIVISPGPGDPSDRSYFGVCADIIAEMGKRIPTLGVCLGHQGIGHAFGGNIRRARTLMHGKTSMIEHDGMSVFKGIKSPLKATRYHSLVIDDKTFPKVLQVTARSLDDKEIMGTRHIQYPIEGIQFHPESILTEVGKQILKNFLEGAQL